MLNKIVKEKIEKIKGNLIGATSPVDDSLFVDEIFEDLDLIFSEIKQKPKKDKKEFFQDVLPYFVENYPSLKTYSTESFNDYFSDSIDDWIYDFDVEFLKKYYDFLSTSLEDKKYSVFLAKVGELREDLKFYKLTQKILTETDSNYTVECLLLGRVPKSLMNEEFGDFDPDYDWKSLTSFVPLMEPVDWDVILPRFERKVLSIEQECFLLNSISQLSHNIDDATSMLIDVRSHSENFYEAFKDLESDKKAFYVWFVLKNYPDAYLDMKESKEEFTSLILKNCLNGLDLDEGLIFTAMDISADLETKKQIQFIQNLFERKLGDSKEIDLTQEFQEIDFG